VVERDHAESPGSGGASPYLRRDFLLATVTFPDCFESRPGLTLPGPGSSSYLRPKKELPVVRELTTDTDTDTYFFGSHFAQFAANSSTLSFVTGISSPLTKVEGGFLFSATMSYSISTDLVPHS